MDKEGDTIDTSKDAASNLEAKLAPFPTKDEILAQRRSALDMEGELADAIDRLRENARLTEIAPVRLGNYWSPEMPRAPFEEEITFGQLSQMKASTILEKRGVTARRVEAILAAIELALKERKPEPVSKPADPVRAQSSQVSDHFLKRALPIVTHFMVTGAGKTLLRLFAEIFAFAIVLITLFAISSYLFAIDPRAALLSQTSDLVPRSALGLLLFFSATVIMLASCSKMSSGRTEQSAIFSATLVVALFIWALIYELPLGWLGGYIVAVFLGSFLGYRLSFLKHFRR